MSKWAENISAKSKRTSRPVLLSEIQNLQRNTANMRNKLADPLADNTDTYAFRSTEPFYAGG